MILRWENGSYYPVEHGIRTAERQEPLGEVLSHRDIIRRIRALASDGIQINGAKLRFGACGGGAYNQYLDITAIPHHQSGLSVSNSSLRNGEVVILVSPDASMLPGQVVMQNKRAFIDLPWKSQKGTRFFVLDEGGNGLVTVTLECDGGERVRAVPPVSLGSWLSSECPASTPKYALEENGSVIRCPDGRLLESADGAAFSDEDLSSLNKSGLARLLGKYRLRRARRCQG